MRYRSSFVFALLVLSACQPRPTQLDEEVARSVEAEVREAVAALVESRNAGDGERLVSFYHDDPGFVYLGCTDVIQGGETFNQLVTPVYSSENPQSYEASIVGLQLLGPDAAVVSLRGSSPEQSALFSTQVWTWDGRWGIALEHESWPGCSEPPAPHPYTAPTEEAGLRPGNGDG